MTAAETEARAAGIEAAIAAIESRVADTEQAMQRFPAVLKNYQATVAAIVPGLLDTLRKLAADTRSADASPADTIRARVASLGPDANDILTRWDAQAIPHVAYVQAQRLAKAVVAIIETETR